MRVRGGGPAASRGPDEEPPAQFIFEIAAPANWMRVPRSGTFICDPDEQDSAPRYMSPPDGGWEPIGRAVTAAFTAISALDGGPFRLRSRVEINVGELTPVAEWTLALWFREGLGPLIQPEVAEIVDGRHRIWGLLSSGFDFAPAAHLMVADAIRALNPVEGEDAIKIDTEFVDEQQKALEWWSSAEDAEPWRSANPRMVGQWSLIVDALEQRRSAMR